MPLGDPHGGNFVYTTEGLPKGIAAISIPTRDVDRSVRFYEGLLGFRLLSRGEDVAIMAVGRDMVILRRSDATGVDTGLYMSTESVFDLHRRLIDEGVIFVIDPKRVDIGLITRFRDDDGNIIGAVEMIRKKM